MKDQSPLRRAFSFALVVTGTTLGLMGIDLVLPAVPSLPEALGGDAATAQLVLAAYAAGTAAGLIAFGALGDRFSTPKLFTASLLATGVLSVACAFASTLEVLVALRVLQGAVAAGPAVFAPAVVRALYDEVGAVRAFGLLGSVESLTPALAPIVGAWLLRLGGWPLSFEVLAGLAFVLALTVAASGLIPETARRKGGGYAGLVASPVFLRYALSQALTLGGLLVFVFGVPSVFVRALGLSLADFVVMQVCGIVAFIAAASSAGRLVNRFGAERMITSGTAVCAAGAGAILLYAASGGTNPLVVTALFVPFNLGLGLRGPPGFLGAVLASRGDDARGSALVIFFVLVATAAGTAAVAPLIESGLVPISVTAFVMELAALGCLALPHLPDP